MKDLKETILEKLYHQPVDEKLVFNKHTKAKHINEFIFNPKGTDKDAKEINNLKIALPFDIIVTNNNDQQIAISKIEYDSTYDFDSWGFYDINDKYIMGLTNVGVRRLFITNEQIEIWLYGDSKYNSYVMIDPKTLTIL